MPVETTTARLLLMTGSHAGLEAPLQLGYYMIGRDAECQIRPKSRSVSRKHCLLHNDDGKLTIFDLDSTSGTIIHDQRLAAKCWHTLADGDILRLGKVRFQVCLAQHHDAAHQPDHDARHTASNPSNPERRGAADTVSPTAKASPDPPSPPARSPKGTPIQPSTARQSIVSGAAWKTFDIAGFLESEDNLDREERYDKIRIKHQQAVADEEAALDLFDLDDESLGSLAELDTAAPGDPRQTANRPGRDGTGPNGSSAAQRTRSAKSHRSKSKTASRFSDRIRFPSLSGMGAGADLDSIKMLAVCLATLAVLGLAGWKAYEFSAGPTVRVIEFID